MNNSNENFDIDLRIFLCYRSTHWYTNKFVSRDGVDDNSHFNMEFFGELLYRGRRDPRF